MFSCRKRGESCWCQEHPVSQFLEEHLKRNQAGGTRSRARDSRASRCLARLGRTNGSCPLWPRCRSQGKSSCSEILGHKGQDAVWPAWGWTWKEAQSSDKAELGGFFAGTAGGAACENEGVLEDLAAGTWSGLSVCMQDFCKVANAELPQVSGGTVGTDSGPRCRRTFERLYIKKQIRIGWLCRSNMHLHQPSLSGRCPHKAFLGQNR